MQLDDEGDEMSLNVILLLEGLMEDVEVLRRNNMAGMNSPTWLAMCQYWRLTIYTKRLALHLTRLQAPSSWKLAFPNELTNQVIVDSKTYRWHHYSLTIYIGFKLKTVCPYTTW